MLKNWQDIKSIDKSISLVPGSSGKVLFSTVVDFKLSNEKKTQKILNNQKKMLGNMNTLHDINILINQLIC